MPLRDWGRAWDVLYWSGLVVTAVAGLVLPVRWGVGFLGLAAFLLILAPFRGQPTTFWPVLSAYLGFAVGFTAAGLSSAQPVVPGLLAGLGLAAVAAATAVAVTRKQRQLSDERGRRA